MSISLMWSSIFKNSKIKYKKLADHPENGETTAISPASNQKIYKSYTLETYFKFRVLIKELAECSTNSSSNKTLENEIMKYHKDFFSKFMNNEINESDNVLAICLRLWIQKEPQIIFGWLNSTKNTYNHRICSLIKTFPTDTDLGMLDFNGHTILSYLDPVLLLELIKLNPNLLIHHVTHNGYNFLMRNKAVLQNTKIFTELLPILIQRNFDFNQVSKSGITLLTVAATTEQTDETSEITKHLICIDGINITDNPQWLYIKMCDFDKTSHRRRIMNNLCHDLKKRTDADFFFSKIVQTYIYPQAEDHLIALISSISDLFNDKINLNRVDDNGNTILHYAAMKNYRKLLLHLVTTYNMSVVKNKNGDYPGNILLKNKSKLKLIPESEQEPQIMMPPELVNLLDQSPIV